MARPSKPDKTALKQELVTLLQQQLAALEAAHDATIHGATHEEAKPENDKDTRALEQTYLARGQASRVEEARADLVAASALQLPSRTATAPAALGCLVTAQVDDDEKHYFLAPAGGGLSLARGSVLVVTPRSPLGALLLGKTAGDGGQIKLNGRARDVEILRVV